MNAVTLFNIAAPFGAVSAMTAPSVASAMPVATPCKARARISAAADWATKNRRSASALRPSADAIIGLRPTWSDRRATVRKAAIIVKE